ncbi:MAG: regulatory iron-sulfur-containing complex subunit RicT [Deinococcota bacterium]
MPECVGVRFDNGPKIHYVEAPTEIPELNTPCVVTTRRGLEMATLRTLRKTVDKPIGHWVRAAFTEDMETRKRLDDKARDIKWLIRARARESLKGVKVVRLEFTLDESVLIINYSADDQVSLRPLLREIGKHTTARIEFVQVGPRDQARMIGALGACGNGTCSSNWLQSYGSATIRMARDQQLPLNPQKISGPCGRLMCCLQFEHGMYKDLLAGMPKKGKRACHESTGQCGRISKLHPLKQTVNIHLEEGGSEEFPVSEIVLSKPPQQR